MVSDKARGDDGLAVGLLFFVGFVGIPKEHEIHQDKGDNHKRPANHAASNKIMDVYHRSVVASCQWRG